MEQTNQFKSIQEAVNFTRRAARLILDGCSVGTSPISQAERRMDSLHVIFIRWTGGPSTYSEVKAYIDSLNITLHAGRGYVDFVLTQGAD